MIYLASPYSHPDPDVQRVRFEAVCDRAATMIRDGDLVYSPVAHSHPLAERGVPGDFAFWAEHARQMLSMCDELVVLALPGWEESRGVQAEIAIAREAGIPVSIVTPSVARV